MIKMTQAARISSRIDVELKHKMENVLAQIGIRPSQAITMFDTQIVRRGGIPFELKVPNEATVVALNEDVSKKESFLSAEDLMADSDSNDAE